MPSGSAAPGGGIMAAVGGGCVGGLSGAVGVEAFLQALHEWGLAVARVVVKHLGDEMLTQCEGKLALQRAVTKPSRRRRRLAWVAAYRCHCAVYSDGFITYLVEEVD